MDLYSNLRLETLLCSRKGLLRQLRRKRVVHLLSQTHANMAAKFPADLTRDSDWTKFTLISVLTILLPTLCFQLWRRALEIGISKYPLVDKSLGTFSERRENYLKHGVEYFIKASTKVSCRLKPRVWEIKIC